MLITKIFISAGLLMSQIPENSDTLSTVVVVADRGVTVSRTDTLKVSQSQTITDLLVQSPGAQVGDNGGYSGLKTISLRGMGSPHTVIYVDGVRVGNVQSGQGDLGTLGLSNFSFATIDYAQNSVSFLTARPSFINGRRVGGNVRFSAGSFGTLLSSGRLDWRISDRLTLSANVEGVISEGDFTYGDNFKRENNDLRDIKGGLDLFGTLPQGDWHTKVFCNGSDRGTPGSISWPSNDRQRDRNIFAQSLLRKQFTSLYYLIASAKIAYDDIYYTSSWGDSRYGQTEVQLNSTHKFTILRWLDLSATADVYWDALNSTSYNQQRLGTTGAATAAFHTKCFKADLALLYDGVFDKDRQGRTSFSPSMDLRYSLSDALSIDGFVRRAYRIPTFNELYYVGYGNPDLEPEDALLTDVGIDWHKKTGRWSLKTKIDGFYNNLKDKITSAPSPEDPNIWQPYNIGKVKSAGADVMAGFDWSDYVWTTSFSLKYGFQDAIDKTPDSETYNQQIDYVARHSLSIDASAAVKGWSVRTVWNLRAGRRDSAGEMPDWNTLDLYLSKPFDLGKAGITMLKLNLKNITDTRYELLSGYPMQGFNFIAGIEYKF